MDPTITEIMDGWRRFFEKRGVPESCRLGTEPIVSDALEQLGIPKDSALAYLYQNLTGPFTCVDDPSIPQLLDIVKGPRSIVTFSKEFWEKYSAPQSILAISEIDTMVGLFYDTQKDAVFEVELDLDFEDFLNGNFAPRWESSSEFIISYFGAIPDPAA